MSTQHPSSPSSGPHHAPPANAPRPAVSRGQARRDYPVTPSAPVWDLDQQFVRSAPATRNQQSSAPYYFGPQVPGTRQAPGPATAGSRNIYAAAPQAPRGSQGGGNFPPTNLPPAAPKTPWWQREGMISKVLAGLGVLITLIGVVMMLVLAAQAGYFGPEARVGAGAALSGILIAGGAWLYTRDGGRVGAVALATTGFAGFFMVVVAMTSYYEWLRPTTGLALAGLVTACAVALSTYWRSQPMTVMAFLAIAGLSPVITGGMTLSLVGFLLLLQAAGMVPEKWRGWAAIAPVRTVPVVLALLVAQAGVDAAGTVTLRLSAAAVCAALGLVTVLFRSDRADWMSVGAYAVASLPILAVIPTVDRPFNILVAAMVALLTTIAVVLTRPVGTPVLTVAAIVASWAALQACVSTTTGHLLPALIAVVALGLLSAGHQQRSLPVWSIGAVFTVLAGSTQLGYLNPAVSFDSSYAVATLGALDSLSSVVLTAAVLATVWSARRVLAPWARTPLLLTAPVAVIWTLVVATLSVGVALGGLTGYHAAQLLISAALMAGAMVALMLGLKPDVSTGTCTIIGLSLVAGALSKLFLYDLAALDGMIRAGSFMAVGLLLLAVGTRYAQAFARRGPSQEAPFEPADRRPLG